MLLFTLVLTVLGSLYNAFVGDYTNFVIARIITGLGIGADLALVNAYINEMAPTASRARYTSLIFIMSSLGAFFGIWLGLILTTPPTPFPVGLPFAIATVSGPVFQGPGWRIMYGIGALLAVIGILLRFQLPESPRWLISRGRVDEADRIVTGMEERARRSVPDLPAPTVIPVQAGLIAAFGTFGFIATAVFAYFYGERLERKLWLPISAALTVIGGILIALTASSSFALAAIGAIITFFGFNLWVPMTYAWSAESYPTRARATGFALVDGVGHLGGGVGILLIAPLIPTLIASLGHTTGAVVMMLIIAAFLVAAAIIAQFGIATRQKRLDEVSP